MMPQVLALRVRTRARRRVRLWIPVLPVVILLTPVLVLALVVLLIGSAVMRMSPARGLAAAWGLVAATRGEINIRDLTIHVRVW